MFFSEMNGRANFKRLSRKKSNKHYEIIDDLPEISFEETETRLQVLKKQCDARNAAIIKRQNCLWDLKYNQSSGISPIASSSKKIVSEFSASGNKMMRAASAAASASGNSSDDGSLSEREGEVGRERQDERRELLHDDGEFKTKNSKKWV